MDDIDEKDWYGVERRVGVIPIGRRQRTMLRQEDVES